MQSSKAAFAFVVFALTSPLVPSDIGNQATLIRFTNRVLLGAAQPAQKQRNVDLALKRLATFADRNRIEVRR